MNQFCIFLVDVFILFFKHNIAAAKIVINESIYKVAFYEDNISVVNFESIDFVRSHTHTKFIVSLSFKSDSIRSFLIRKKYI